MKMILAADYLSMCRKAANIISAQVILFPNSVIGLATGSTPLGVYKQLSEWYEKGDLDFAKVCTVNLDEYCGLASFNVQSYRYYMNANLFNKINILPQNTYLPNGSAKDYRQECVRYDQLIAHLGGIDLQLLGIGHNGHIGFNEPNRAFNKMTHKVRLSQKTIEANARFFDNRGEVPRYAITMGMRAIMQAKKILLVAGGQEKADILYQALQGPITPRIPASILQLHPDLTVVGDTAAMSMFEIPDKEALL